MIAEHNIYNCRPFEIHNRSATKSQLVTCIIEKEKERKENRNYNKKN